MIEYREGVTSPLLLMLTPGSRFRLTVGQWHLRPIHQIKVVLIFSSLARCRGSLRRFDNQRCNLIGPRRSLAANTGVDEVGRDGHDGERQVSLESNGRQRERP